MISIKLLCSFIKITLRHECSLVNLLHIFRTPFHKNNSERLLLLVSRGITFRLFACWFTEKNINTIGILFKIDKYIHFDSRWKWLSSFNFLENNFQKICENWHFCDPHIASYVVTLNKKFKNHLHFFFFLIFSILIFHLVVTFLKYQIY